MEVVNKTEFRPVPAEGDTAQEKAVRRIADAVHRTNEAIRQAVDAGLSVELVRVSRYHEGHGNWGDQMLPVIREKGGSLSS
jgi:hypothetical protein